VQAQSKRKENPVIRLQYEREARHLSRRALAQEASIGEANYSRIESARTLPYAPELERIRAALAKRGWEGTATDLLEAVEDAHH
jgi:transcriptional regulator with XRE-family HTH domain